MKTEGGNSICTNSQCPFRESLWAGRLKNYPFHPNRVEFITIAEERLREIIQEELHKSGSEIGRG